MGNWHHRWYGIHYWVYRVVKNSLERKSKSYPFIAKHHTSGFCIKLRHLHVSFWLTATLITAISVLLLRFWLSKLTRPNLSDSSRRSRSNNNTKVYIILYQDRALIIAILSLQKFCKLGIAQHLWFRIWNADKFGVLEGNKSLHFESA